MDDNLLGDDLNPGLKSTSENPLLSGSIPTSSPQSVVNGDDGGPGSASSSYTPLRQKIVHSDDSFFDSRDVSEGLMAQPEDGQHLDLQTLFPDLQALGLLGVPLSPSTTDEETKNRPEEISDKDDDHTERAEDDHSDKSFNDSIWLPIGPEAITPDMDGSDRASEDTSDDLFGFKGRASNTSSSMVLQFHAPSYEDKEPHGRGDDELWTESDDAVLKELVDRYSTNWALVTECFNSSRLTTHTERRTPVECAERWKERWRSAEHASQLSESVLTVGEGGNVAEMHTELNEMTRAIEKFADPSGQGANFASEKKRTRRQHLLQESIRRAAKKRADAMATQRKPFVVHETHMQYNRLPPLTPLELARMKADKDDQERQERQDLWRRQLEAGQERFQREFEQARGFYHGIRVGF